MWSVYFLRKYWMYSKKRNQTRNPCWYQIFFFPQKISKMKTKYSKKKSEQGHVFFYLHSREEKKILEWKQLNTLPLQFWSYKWWLRIKRKDSFDSILELWLFTSHMDICGCSYFSFNFLTIVFFFFFSLFPHETGGIYKRPSAILDTERRCFKDETRSREHGRGSWCGLAVVDPQTWSSEKVGFFFLFVFLFCGEQSCRAAEPSRGMESGKQGGEGRSSQPLLRHSWALAPCPSPTHLCTFVHSSCEVPFWGWEHNLQTGGSLRLASRRKRNSQTELKDWRNGAFSLLL